MWEPYVSRKPPAVALSPADEQKKFWLPPGFRIEPVLADPDIQEPGQIAFDGNGRMFVVELRGYMQDADATGELDHYSEQFEPDLNITWGAPVRIADMQGGMNAVRMPDGSLARATGAAGNDIFRGDRLPKDMIGDYFYGEVVARIVRRLQPVKTEGLTQLRNAYPLSEFLRSTDPLLSAAQDFNSPDGARTAHSRSQLSHFCPFKGGWPATLSFGLRGQSRLTVPFECPV